MEPVTKTVTRIVSIGQRWSLGEFNIPPDMSLGTSKFIKPYQNLTAALQSADWKVIEKPNMKALEVEEYVNSLYDVPPTSNHQIDWMREQGVDLEQATLRGATIFKTKEIFISAELALDDKFATLIHEAAHAILIAVFGATVPIMLQEPMVELISANVVTNLNGGPIQEMDYRTVRYMTNYWKATQELAVMWPVYQVHADWVCMNILDFCKRGPKQ